MLERGRDNTPAHNVTWQQADAFALPFDDDSFEAVVCQFGVMFFPDKVAAYREALRVLKPGGTFFFNVWDRIEENEVAELVEAGVANLFPNHPPSFLSRIPHGFSDTDRIIEDLRTAGFTEIEAHALEHRSRAPSPRHPAIGYCKGSPLRNEIKARHGSYDEAIDAGAELVASRLLLPDGTIDGKIRGFIFTAV